MNQLKGIHLTSLANISLVYWLILFKALFKICLDYLTVYSLHLAIMLEHTISIVSGFLDIVCIYLFIYLLPSYFNLYSITDPFKFSFLALY